MLPGRTAEVRASSRKELAASLAMVLAIGDGNWLMKAAGGWPATPEEADAEPDVVERAGAAAVRARSAAHGTLGADLPVPPSVRRLVEET